jgi:hypothetical protein
MMPTLFLQGKKEKEKRKRVFKNPPEEQQLWLPNQTAHDPDSWHAPNLLNLKMGYDILVNNHHCKVQEMYTV